MLTLYVIPCDNPEEADIPKLKQSAKDVAEKIVVLDHRRLDEVEPETKWYAFLFSNEWFDVGLKDALPIFLEYDECDYFVLFKKVIEDITGTLIPKTFVAPRIFRSSVKLEGAGSLIPRNPESLKAIKVLDGWILEPTRVIQ